MLGTREYFRPMALGLMAAGLALIAQPAAAKCVAPTADFEALKLSKSGVKDQAGVDALPSERQQMLCSTRVLWNRIHANGDRLPKSWPDEEPGFSPSFLSPDELRAFNRLEDDWIDAQVVADQTRHAPKPGGAKAH
jgi:hypothetical protein